MKECNEMCDTLHHAPWPLDSHHCTMLILDSNLSFYMASYTSLTLLHSTMVLDSSFLYHGWLARFDYT